MPRSKKQPKGKCAGGVCAIDPVVKQAAQEAAQWQPTAVRSLEKSLGIHSGDLARLRKAVGDNDPLQTAYLRATELAMCLRLMLFQRDGK